MSNFDSFYGSDNFSGSFSKTTVIEQKEEVVCHSETITIIQQRLLVLQEMAKRSVRLLARRYSREVLNLFI